MSPVESVPTAILNSIDDYVELLYDDIPEKIKGSALILQLARNPDNLIELARNEALLSALSRVLREEWKRSIELSTNIVYTFFCFSTYNEFHPVIIQYKIGSLCMDVIDYELKRYDQWKEKVDGKKLLTPDKSELPKSRIPEPKRRPKSGTWAVADVTLQKTRSLVSSYHEDLCSASDECISKNDEEQMKRKLKTLSKRQEQLLRVAFYMLLNIADNVKVEEKMHKKDIVGLLIGAMERHSNIDLLILIVSFLQKLSIFVENKNNMASRGIIEKLAPLLDSSNADLVNVTLKLLFNLTFDTKLRNKMIKLGLLPKFIQFTSDDKHINLAMKILYHLSMDDRVKLMFTQSDCVKLLTDMLLLNVNAENVWGGAGGAAGAGGAGGAVGATDVLVALCVNLAWCERAAQQMVAEGRLRELLARAFRHRNTVLMKIARNLSHHPQNQPLFVEFVGDIAGAVTSGDTNEEFLIECMGTLSNILNPNNIDIYAVVERYKLIPCIMKILDPEGSAGGEGEAGGAAGEVGGVGGAGEASSAELVLEGVVMAGALCAEGRAAGALARARGAEALVALLRLRQADDEHVLQTVFAFRQMLAHPRAAQHLVTRTEAPAYLIDLMQDKNAEIRKMCDQCLDIISQMQNEWAARIQVERFRCHNGQWLAVVETLGAEGGAAGGGGGGGGGGAAGGVGGAGDAADDLPPYLSAEYLTTHRLTTSDSQTSLNDDSDSLSGDGDMHRGGSRNSAEGRKEELYLTTDSSSGKASDNECFMNDLTLLA